MLKQPHPLPPLPRRGESLIKQARKFCKYILRYKTRYMLLSFSLHLTTIRIGVWNNQHIPRHGLVYTPATNGYYLGMIAIALCNSWDRGMEQPANTSAWFSIYPCNKWVAPPDEPAHTLQQLGYRHGTIGMYLSII